MTLTANILLGLAILAALYFIMGIFLMLKYIAAEQRSLVRAINKVAEMLELQNRLMREE